MIKPTVGRIVLFHPAPLYAEEGIPTITSAPLAALVVHVHGDGLLILTVFDSMGGTHARTYVTLIQAGEDAPEGEYCEWMPYQLGQAAKTEELQKKLA